MTEQDLKTLAENATTRETFNFVDAVNNRAYPEITVPVLLNERGAQRLVELRKDIEQLDYDIAREKNAAVQEELTKQKGALIEELDRTTTQLRAETYKVLVKGVGTDRIEELQKQAFEQFPVEYEESVSPITGATVKTEVPNEKRGRYFTTLVRHAHIVSITAPTGAVAEEMSIEELGAAWSKMPIAARERIDQAINDCTLAADYYLELVDEVFSQRP